MLRKRFQNKNYLFQFENDICKYSQPNSRGHSNSRLCRVREVNIV
jgi:hypothetical protein